MSFNSQALLESLQILHWCLQEIPSCTTCSKTFSTMQSYRRHCNAHVGIYRYRCQFCNKGFSCTKDMKQHLTGHTNMNYFKCTECNETFRYDKHLKEHGRLVHNHAMWKCFRCLFKKIKMLFACQFAYFFTII